MSPFGGDGDPKIGGLKHALLFSECSDKELKWVASEMDEVEFGAGHELTRKGSPNHSFYVLLEGEVEATLDGKVLARLTPGDFFGEISMLDRGPATATVTTKTPIKALVMSHQQFRDSIRSNETLLAGVMAAMAARLRANAEIAP
jgi:CRP-like cAMP-binding protein